GIHTPGAAGVVAVAIGVVIIEQPGAVGEARPLRGGREVAVAYAAGAPGVLTKTGAFVTGAARVAFTSGTAVVRATGADPHRVTRVEGGLHAAQLPVVVGAVPVRAIIPVG